jgi:hypothetical protein
MSKASFTRLSSPFVSFPTPSPDTPLLVVPDVHQDFDFLQRAVALAVREGAALCFLGDHVDGVSSRWRDPAHLRAVADLVISLARTHPRGCLFLAGNHDVDALHHARARHALSQDVAGLAALDAARPPGIAYSYLMTVWPEEFLATWRIATIAHGYLLSHAGVARRHWPWSASGQVEAQAQAFLQLADKAWRGWLTQGTIGPLFAAGPARGGSTAPVGGPLWLDWDNEFVDDLPLPQVVGHTRSREPRRKDRSWCLDAAQTAVGLLHPDLGLRVLRV